MYVCVLNAGYVYTIVCSCTVRLLYNKKHTSPGYDSIPVVYDITINAHKTMTDNIMYLCCTYYYVERSEMSNTTSSS